MLNILIPSIPERASQLKRLTSELFNQIEYCRKVHPTLGSVSYIVDNSKRFLDGGLSIGQKRQRLIDAATEPYLCFLDDDESISPSYVETLLRLCNQDKDVCTFRNISKFDNYWCVVDLSLQNENEQAGELDIVRRKPWHICPVRSIFAKTATFPDSNYGEDWLWFEQILPHLQTEAKTNAVIHQYNHSVKTSEADKAHETSCS